MGKEVLDNGSAFSAAGAASPAATPTGTAGTAPTGDQVHGKVDGGGGRCV